MPTLQLAIDSAGAKTGATEFEQASNKASAAAGKTATDVDKMNKSFSSVDKAVGIAVEALKKTAQLAGVSVGIWEAIEAIDAYQEGAIKLARATGLAGPQLNQFNQQLVVLSTRAPVNSADLYEVVRIAASIGITGTENIMKFSTAVATFAGLTKTPVDETAKSLGRMLSMTGESANDANNLASVFVKMSGTSLASASSLLSMSSQLVQSSANMKVTAADAAAFSSVLGNLGVDSGREIMTLSHLMNTLEDATRKGQELGKVAASVAGQSPGDFSNLFKTDASSAIIAFLSGLQRISAAGGNVTAILDQFSLSTDRTDRVLPGLIGHANDLAKALATARTEMGEGNTMNERAAEDFSETGNQLKLLGNTLLAIPTKLGSVDNPFRSLIKTVNDATREMFGFQAQGEQTSTASHALAITLTGLAIGSTSLVGIKVAIWMYELTVQLWQGVSAAYALQGATGPLVLVFAALAGFEFSRYLVDQFKDISTASEQTTNFIATSWGKLQGVITKVTALSELEVYQMTSKDNVNIGNIVRTVAGNSLFSNSQFSQDMINWADSLQGDSPEKSARIKYLQNQMGGGTDQYTQDYLAMNAQAHDAAMAGIGSKFGADGRPITGRMGFGQFLTSDMGALNKMLGFAATPPANLPTPNVTAPNSVGGSGGPAPDPRSEINGMIEKLKVEQQYIGLKDNEKEIAQAMYEANTIADKEELKNRDGLLVQLKSQIVLNQQLKAYATYNTSMDDINRQEEMVGLTDQQRAIEQQIWNMRINLGPIDAAQRETMLNNMKLELEHLQDLQDHWKMMTDIAKGVGGAFGDALTDIITGTKSAEDAIKTLMEAITKLIVQQAVATPIANGLTSFLVTGLQHIAVAGIGGGGTKAVSGSGNAGDAGTSTPATAVVAAMGKLFSGGRVIPFAEGDIFNSPTMFPMSGGNTGLMGEAGPEAIMPLTRGANGKLGVANHGGSSKTTVVNVNVTGVQDADSFRKSKRQIASEVKKWTGS